MKFYLSLECVRCEGTIYYGPVLSLLEHNGLPVVPATFTEQELFACRECGAQNYVGELDVYVEGGDDRDDDENEEN